MPEEAEWKRLQKFDIKTTKGSGGTFVFAICEEQITLLKFVAAENGGCVLSGSVSLPYLGIPSLIEALQNAHRVVLERQAKED